MKTLNINLALSALIRPVRTFRLLSETNEKLLNREINLLLWLSAFCMALSSVFDHSKDNMSWPGTTDFIMLFVATLFIFVAYKYAFSWLFWKISRMLEGKITLQQTRSVLAFALLPALIYPPVILIKLAAAIYYNDPQLLYYSNKITLLVISLIAFRIAIPGLAIFNRYSYGYALLTLLLPFAVLQLIYLAL